VDVERFFSRGRLNITQMRHSLAPETIRALMLLYSYHDAGMIPEEAELLKLLKRADAEEARKRKEAREQVETVVVSP
jgi:hypothetical protein